MATIILPPELMTLILEHLPQSDLHTCTKVDKLFHATATPILWRSPKFPDPTSLILFSRCLTLAKEPRGKLVRCLLLSDASIRPYVNDGWLLFIAPHLPLLDTLELASCPNVTDRSLARLVRHCPALETLVLEDSSVTFRTIFELAYYCPNLRVLNLRDCQHISPLALLPFTRHRHLVHLILTDCHCLSDETAQDLRELPRLRLLELINCRSLGDPFLQAVASADLSDLAYLSLSGNPGFTDAGIVPFLETHPSLQDISLARCTITDATLKAVARHLPLLLSLDVAFCPRISPGAVRECVVWCRYLEMVGLTGCEGVRAADFPELKFREAVAELELDALWFDQIGTIRQVEKERIERERNEKEEEEIGEASGSRRDGAGRMSGADTREESGEEGEDGEGEEEVQSD